MTVHGKAVQGIALVVIGREWDSDARKLRRALESICMPRTGDEADGVSCTVCEPRWDAGAAEHVRTLIRGDRRFELIDIDHTSLDVGIDDDSSGDRQSKRARWAPEALSLWNDKRLDRQVIHFQLVGASVCGVTRVELERAYAVDLDALNLEFAEQVNIFVPRHEDCPKPCLTSGLIMAPHLAKPVVSVRFSVGGACKFEHIWPSLSEVADAVLERMLARIKLCRCDVDIAAERNLPQLWRDTQCCTPSRHCTRARDSSSHRDTHATRASTPMALCLCLCIDSRIIFMIMYSPNLYSR